ncbi:MAG: nucleotidyltransferase domain-containing protein [Anaerolineae bacterium]|mgnify:FL=1
MVTIPSAIEQSVARFIAAAQQQQRIVTAYLYGSQVKGTATQWSDIDVALVSPDFAANLFQARVALLHLAAQIDDRIEPHPFTPDDFTINHPLVSEIRQTGVRLV